MNTMIRQVSIPAAEYISMNGIEQYIRAIQIKEEIPEHVDYVMKLLYDNEVIAAQRLYELNQKVNTKKKSNERLLYKLNEINSCICGVKRKISEIE
jgi:hypothetical protein